MDQTVLVKVGLFVLLSAAIVVVSVSSLRHPGSHGFYRFFAWEAMVALFVVNVQRWFVDPFSPRQIAAWVLLTVSLVLVLEAVRLLGKVGGPREKAAHEHGEYEWEETTRLVDVGAFRWIRHPMYSSLLFLTWGIFLKDPTWIATLLSLLATAFLYATARADEREDIEKFGDEYVGYMGRTKRFIPWVW